LNPEVTTYYSTKHSFLIGVLFSKSWFCPWGCWRYRFWREL